MIRIAIIAGVLHTGGKRNLIMEYYRHLDKNKIQCDFICDSNSNGIPDAEILKLGGRIYKVAPYKNLIPHLIDTYRILRKNRYQIIHAYDNTLNLFPMFLGWLAGINVRISESISKGDKREKKSLFKYLLRPFSCWFTDLYMANSIDCGIWQFGSITYGKGEVAIFRTVIDTDKNAFDEHLRKSTREKFNLKDKTVYGFIGRYVSQKNPLFLIDIFYEITKIDPTAVLVLIGFGELENQMHNRISSYGISDRVFDYGRRDDIRQFYNAFDAFLLPSLYEGMPVVGIEAQCAGLPVFFSDSITKETTASPLAYYIGLEELPSKWAEKIVEITKSNMMNRRGYAEEVKISGFDSFSESLRLQNYYINKVKCYHK